jgi:phosphate/sulfate permease
MSQKKEIEKSSASSSRPVLVGAVVGAGAGIVAAMLLNRRAQKHGRESMVTIPEAIQLGLLVFGLFRAISSLGSED